MGENANHSFKKVQPSLSVSRARMVTKRPAARVRVVVVDGLKTTGFLFVLDMASCGPSRAAR